MLRNSKLCSATLTIASPVEAQHHIADFHLFYAVRSVSSIGQQLLLRYVIQHNRVPPFLWSPNGLEERRVRGPTTLLGMIRVHCHYLEIVVTGDHLSFCLYTSITEPLNTMFLLPHLTPLAAHPPPTKLDLVQGTQTRASQATV